MTLTPPAGASAATEAPLVLTPPKAVDQVVEGDQASQMLGAVPADKQLELDTRAKNFTNDLVKFDVHSPEFKARVKELASLAQSTIVATTEAPNRILERNASSVAGSKKQGSDASQDIAKDLTKLRGLVEDLTPNQADLVGIQKIFGIIPGGSKIRHYFQRYQNAQEQLNGIINALLKGQDELGKDNASLQQEQVDLWENMGKLNEYSVLATKLDQKLVDEIAQLRGAGNVAAAQALENDVLFVVRQRRQDILTQLAVSVQAYLAMDVVQKNNEELIKGVDRARNVTISALRTAVIIAQALDSQKLVLDQIDALRSTTERTILANSEMLKQNSTRIQQQAADPAVSVKVLDQAFKNVFDTIDAIDTFKSKANVSMNTTINALGQSLERAKPALERAKAVDSQAQQAALTDGEI